MKKAVIIGGLIIIIGIIILVISNEQIKETDFVEDEKTTEENRIIDLTQISGPFQINKSEYKLGEKIFLHVGGLQNTEKGEIIFGRPINDTEFKSYAEIPFDGFKKSSFNQYIEIELLKSRGVCNTEDLIGTWILWFKGTIYPSIEFEVIDEIIGGHEIEFSESVC